MGRTVRSSPLLATAFYLVTNVDHFVLLFFRLESTLTWLTAAVSVRVVFAGAFTCTVIATSAPTGLFDVHAARLPRAQEPATLPHEFFGAVIEQLGVLLLRLHDSTAYPELTNVVPAGRVSASVTPFAVFGPRLTTEM
jgi:hypothetical protein